MDTTRLPNPSNALVNATNAAGLAGAGALADAKKREIGAEQEPEVQNAEAFNPEAGVTGSRHAAKTIRSRIAAKLRKSAKAQKAEESNQSGEDSELGAAASKFIAKVGGASKDEQEEEMRNMCEDPLGQYRLLEEAMSSADSAELPPGTDREQLKEQLGEMMSDLKEKYGDELKQGIEVTNGAQMVVDKLAANGVDLSKVPGLSMLFNGSGKTCPTAMDVVKEICGKAGGKNFADAFAGMRAGIAANNRDQRTQFHARKGGPAVWISMEISGVLQKVQSAYSIAEPMSTALINELIGPPLDDKGEMWKKQEKEREEQEKEREDQEKEREDQEKEREEQEKKRKEREKKFKDAPFTDKGKLTELLLAVPQSGNYKSADWVKQQIGDLDSEPNLRKAKAYRVVMEAIDATPDHWWPAKMAKGDMVGALWGKITSIDYGSSSQQRKDKKKEKRLRSGPSIGGGEPVAPVVPVKA